MRVLFFAKDHKKTGNTAHILRGFAGQGHQVRHLNRRRFERLMGKRLAWWVLQRKVGGFQPDLVLVYSCDLPANKLQELREQGYTTATFFDDCPRELDARIKASAAASDVFAITNRGQVALFEEQTGTRAVQVTGACDPEDHFRVPFDPTYASDVAFIGRPDERGERVPVLRALAEHYDVRVYGPGNWEELGFKRGLKAAYSHHYRAICNSAKVMVGCDLRADVDQYFSNRTWLTLGCGGFLATRYVPNLEEIFTDGEHCAFWRSPQHAVDVVGRYLEDEQARQRVAQAGHDLAHSRYEYRHLVQRLLGEPAFAGKLPQ
ncbi:glycosyltransferase [Planctomycetota bacterium]|nr:glycosyltransferase [Planctomycetota bacterium]